MRPTLAVALFLLLPLAGGACTAPVYRAAAALEPLAESAVAGNASFVEREGTTTIRVEARNVAPGLHGVHVHTVGDCSAPDGSSAGGHFNPDGGLHGHGHEHGHAQGDHHHHGGHDSHGGDLGNLEADTDGAGVLVVETDGLTVQRGPRSVVGRAIVIHALADDMVSQPGGAAGARIGCGVIRSTK